MTPMNMLSAWGLESGHDGKLVVVGCSAIDLAAQYGTPLHVVHEGRLEETARSFVTAATAHYPGVVSVHYPFKCNAVPAVVQTIRRAGMKAEVMTEFELALAFSLGFRNDEIIVNGPCKTDEFLSACLDERVGLLIVDAVE